MRYLALLTGFCIFCISGSRAQCPVIPTPSVYNELSGDLLIDEYFLVSNDGVDSSTLFYFLNEVKLNFGLDLNIQSGQGNLNFKKLTNVPADYYTIDVGKQITIKYSSNASCFYALNSLVQLMQEDGNNVYIKHCFLGDQPRFQWRGLHLDVSRHFYTIREIKRFLDLMALYKFNKFHWHLTDDQGWRIEILQYPELTKIGAYRKETLIGHASDEPQQMDGKEHGGYYTQENIREIIVYASERFIDVIPEIELPGHSRAALAAYPDLSCTGNIMEVPGTWGVFEDNYCSKDETIDFLKNVLSEVVNLFPYEYIHIGGDEAPKTRWKECPRCQEVMKIHNLPDEHALQSYFIGEMDAFLTSKNKKLIGWDEILEGGLSPNAAVMSWRGEAGGIEAAKQGHYVVMSPTTYCYFDYYQSANKNEPLAIGGYLPLEKVYMFDPMPVALKGHEQSYILGGQANLWTEYIPGIQQLEYMTYPRALAMAQSLWCVNKPSYENFLEVYLKYQEDFLDKHEVNYSKSIHYPEMKIVRAKDGIKVHFKGPEKNYEFELFTKEQAGFSMNKGVKLHKSDSLYFERMSGNTRRKFVCRLSSEHYETIVDFQFDFHSSIGLPIDLITPPHPKYNHNGSLNLVDGVFGQKPWKGTDWLGFDTKEVVFTVDLLEYKELDSIKLGFLNAEGAWIYLPETVEVFYSKSNGSWKSAGKTSVKDEKFAAKVNQKARYLKIVITSLDEIPANREGAGFKPWTFIDELEIIYPE